MQLLWSKAVESLTVGLFAKCGDVLCLYFFPFLSFFLFGQALTL